MKLAVRPEVRVNKIGTDPTGPIAAHRTTKAVSRYYCQAHLLWVNWVDRRKSDERTYRQFECFAWGSFLKEAILSARERQLAGARLLVHSLRLCAPAIDRGEMTKISMSR